MASSAEFVRASSESSPTCTARASTSFFDHTIFNDLLSDLDLTNIETEDVPDGMRCPLRSVRPARLKSTQTNDGN